jgi:hypothetical protein
MMTPLKRAAIGAALVATTVAGGAIGASMLGSAGAQSTSTTSATTAVASSGGAAYGTPSSGQFDPTKGGHVGTNGVKEELLTGTTADNVRAAASAAVPGATIQRVETDAEGAAYEAHITKADGTNVTVKIDKNFKVTTVETDSNHGGTPHSAPSTTTG